MIVIGYLASILLTLRRKNSLLEFAPQQVPFGRMDNAVDVKKITQP